MPTQHTHAPRAPVISERFRPLGSSIFAEMSKLALEHKAVNLSQGFPDFDGPEVAKEGAIAAIREGHSQYARMMGVPVLNQAIAASWARRGRGSVDPEREVTVTTGCSEAIVSAFLGLINPGDEVVIIEPYFDFYTAAAAMAGAVCRFVTLRPPPSGHGPFELDGEELRRAFTARTKAIVVNTPHNPTGKVFTRGELELIAELCQKHGAIAITDEVYEDLVYEPGLPHIALATLPGMEDRTVTLSSLGKTFSLTGWKVGWAIAPAHLTAGVRAAHQFNTFSSATPLQYGAAAVLRTPGDYVTGLCALYVANRDLLESTLRGLGLRTFASHATYFLMADYSALRRRDGSAFEDDRAFCMFLTREVGVAAIPPSVFYSDPARGRHLVRFAFCKKRETMEEAVRRMLAMAERLSR